MSLITWTSGSQAGFAPNKIEGGVHPDGNPIYVARAYYKDGKHPGKFSIETRGQCAIGYSGKEHFIPEFEIAESTATFTWVPFSGEFTLAKFKALGKGDPVEGGSAPTYTTNWKVTPLYICKADITDRHGKQVGTHCGKVWENTPSASIPYGTEEFNLDDYEVLAHSG